MLKGLVKKFIKKESIDYRLLERRYFYRFSSKSKLLKLRDKFKGERCFIIGNGPSLNQCDLRLLRGEYSFGVNGIFYKTDEMGFKPTFFVVEDAHVMDDNLETIDTFDTEYRFFPTDYKHLIKNKANTYFFNMNTGYYERSSPNFGIPRFSTDCSRIVYCGQSVTMINLQLAFYLGFTKVYLIGMDFEYEIPETASIDGSVITSNEDDTNHFHPEYFGKGKKWHDPELEKVYRSYECMKLCYKSAGREILNATKGGKLEIFPRVSYDSLFG
jgi:hypothetical protein